ncbi:MAG: hypothetical protein LBO82_03780 [Synergistaceae bacterium]|nr:hypothetical protein [Synergistaceae bacterium]
MSDFEFQNGDLVFIRGKTWRSFFVTFAEVKANDFSHVGIIRIADGTPYVIHAAPERETVKIESIDIFLSPANADHVGLYRLANRPHLAERAAGEAWRYFKEKVPFDHQFDISDEKKLYCTELVWLAYKHVGVNLDEMDGNFLRDVPIYGKVLLPTRLSESRLLTRICGFRY